MAEFEAQVTLPCSPDEVFAFLIRPENIAKISHPDLGLVFVDPPSVLEQGSRLEFKIHGFGVVQHAIHEITALNHPLDYTESQIKGPLKSWRHQHLFVANADGGVTVIDQIEFQPPGGLLGLMATESRIRDSLDEGFDHRHWELQKLWS